MNNKTRSLSLPMRLAAASALLVALPGGLLLLILYLTGQERQSILAAAAVFAVFVPVGAAAGWLFGRWLVAPLLTLTEGAERIAKGDLAHQLEIRRRDEFGRLANAFNRMTAQVRETMTGLEMRVAVRTRELAQHSSYLAASAEVGRVATSILQPEMLIQQVVEVIRERFDLYYVGLFLVDEAGEWAVLRAATGAAGQAMLARRHRIRVGQGMIGWCIANGQARIALEASSDAVRLTTAELPETRSEAALPLRARGKVSGAFTVQSDRPATFNQDRIVVLQTMADQVAVALENARLFAESQQALEKTRRAYGELSRQAWTRLAQTRSNWGYYCDENGVVPLSEMQAPPKADSEHLPTLKLPLLLRGQVIGSLEAHKPDSAGEWQADEIALLNTLMGQLEVALESARLFRETQERAAREQLISQATRRMRESLDLDAVMQSAVSEMRRALNLVEVEARLSVSGTEVEAYAQPH